jgi:hypothetical protein
MMHDNLLMRNNKPDRENAFSQLPQTCSPRYLLILKGTESEVGTHCVSKFSRNACLNEAVP